MIAYSGPLVRNEFYDADNPQYPMALPEREWDDSDVTVFEVVRTDVVGTQIFLHDVGEDPERGVIFRHYVRRKNG